MNRYVLDIKEARARYNAATQTRTPAALWTSLADIPVLLAAARATLAADRDGEAEPLFYVRDELAAHGQLPPWHLHPAELLALAALPRKES